ncbi:MAG TPA: alpha/beta fold hydrolase [Myxococcota bacterium]|nr:alpha/beta fold hydrolase [Myxococcota bacterium]
MSGPRVRELRWEGEPLRVWERGEGEGLGFLAGIGGLSTWTPFLERLAQQYRVVVPSLPGFPGGGSAHRRLDDLLDWISVTLDLLEGAGLSGAHLVGHGPGGLLAAEVAALSRGTVRKLVLLAPFGLFDPSEPVADCFARRASEIPALFSTHPEAFARSLECPPADDEVEWQLTKLRASEAAARLLWPTGEFGLAKRLHRIVCPTLLLWGSEDRVVPASYAKRFADSMGQRPEIRSIEGAGHRLDLDAPDAAADAILAFLRAGP